MTVYKVQEIANYIIDYSNQRGFPISNLRLQKLLYFTQGEFFKEKNKPAFEEPMKAWHYGPVSHEVYSNYANNGAMNIPSSQQIWEYEEWSPFGGIPSKYREVKDDDKRLIEDVIDYYSDYEDFELVDLSHEQEPWSSVYDPDDIHNYIDNERIKQYFKNQGEQE